MFPLRQPDVIKGRNTQQFVSYSLEAERVSRWKRKKSVFIRLRQRMSESLEAERVSLRNQKSQCSEVSPRREPSQ
jgi:hypothetical protein